MTYNYTLVCKNTKNDKYEGLQEFYTFKEAFFKFNELKKSKKYHSVKINIVFHIGFRIL